MQLYNMYLNRCGSSQVDKPKLEFYTSITFENSKNTDQENVNNYIHMQVQAGLKRSQKRVINK